jgi:exonuclease VII large subunit
MKEKALLYISIVCSVVGLVVLYYISQVIELPKTDIVEITPDDIGKNVKVCGEIVSKSVSRNKHVFLQLQDTTDKIDVVIFNNSVEKLNATGLKKGENVCIIGTIDEYQGKLEVLPKQIIR